MAFNLTTFATAKYRHSFVSDTGTSRIWEIHEDGFAGTVDTITASGKGHCVIRYMPQGDDEFFPVLPSEATVSLFDEDKVGGSTKVLEDIYGAVRTTQASDNKYAIVIREGSAILFAGLVDTSDMTYLEDGARSITLKASDGYRMLGKVGYVSDTADGAMYTGSASITSIIAECLSATPWGFNFSTAANLYPRKTGTQLAATANPFDNIWVDRIAFRKRGDDKKPDEPISVGDVLNSILTRFACQIHQEGGVWKIVQTNLRYDTTYREWLYDSTGAAVGSPNYSTVTPAVTPSNETKQRTRASIQSGLKSYSAVSSTYAHGRATLVKYPDFYGFGLENRNYQVYPTWVSSDATNAKFVDIGKDGTGIRINDIDGTDWTTKTGYASVTNVAGQGVANATGTGVGTVDAAIGNYKFTQVTEASVPATTNLLIQLELNPVSESGQVNFDGTANLAVAFQVKSNSTTPTYLTMDGARGASWSTTANWILLENLGTKDSWWKVLIEADGTALDVGTLDFVLGPVFDNSVYERNAGPQDDVAYVLYNFADIDVELGDGVYNTEATITTNYVDRVDLVIRGASVNAIGDGPLSISYGAMFNDVLKADDTSDWKEGVITGAASGDSIDKLWTRLILRATSNPRRLHSATYFGLGQILTPSDVLIRGGSRWMPRDLEVNLVQDINTGSWYQARQDVFDDDIESGTKGGSTTGSFLGRFDSSSAGLYQYKLGRSFFTDGARRVAVTSAAIPAGTGTASISVDAITNAILFAGDRIIIFAPDLSVYQARVKTSQLKGATSIEIEDPDNPGSNFNFAEEVAFPASIYFAEDEMLTIARLGEQGFKINVLGQPLGKVDGAQSGTITQLTVKEWIASADIGDVVNLADGTALTLTADIRPGETVIYFSSAVVSASDNEKFVNSTEASFSVTAAQVATNVTDISTNAGNISGNAASIVVNANQIALNVTDISTHSGEISANTSSISLESGRIDLGLERSEDRIGVITSVSTGDTLTLSGGINNDLFDGDFILIINKTTGAVSKREVKTDAAQFDTSVVLTTTITVAINDVIYATTSVGLRIDMDGIGVKNTHLYNTGTNPWDGTVNAAGAITIVGTRGWIITRDGKAEFSDVTVRGNLGVSNIVGDLTLSGGAVVATSLGAGNGAISLSSSGLVLTMDSAFTTPIDIKYHDASSAVSLLKVNYLLMGSTHIAQLLNPGGMLNLSASTAVGGESGASITLSPSGSDTSFDWGDPLVSVAGTLQTNGNLAGNMLWNIFHSTASKQIVGTASGQTSMVPTGNGSTTLYGVQAGAVARVRASGRYLSDSTYCNIDFVLGGVDVWRTGSFEFPTTSSTYYDWYGEWDIVFTSTSAAIVTGRMVFEDGDSAGNIVRGYGQDRTSQNISWSGISTLTTDVDLGIEWGGGAGIGDVIVTGIFSIDMVRNTNE